LEPEFPDGWSTTRYRQKFATSPERSLGEAMLWLKNGFGFSGEWTVNDQNDLLARLF
jgi:hypothetical protein